MHVHQTARLALLSPQVRDLDVQHLLLRHVVVQQHARHAGLGHAARATAARLLAVVGDDAGRTMHVAGDGWVVVGAGGGGGGGGGRRCGGSQATRSGGGGGGGGVGHGGVFLSGTILMKIR